MPDRIFSVCYTVGAYSKWLDASSSGQSILPSVIDILMSGMGTSEDSAAAAALAFRHICAGTNFLFKILFFSCIFLDQVNLDIFRFKIELYP